MLVGYYAIVLDILVFLTCRISKTLNFKNGFLFRRTTWLSGARNFLSNFPLRREITWPQTTSLLFFAIFQACCHFLSLNGLMIEEYMYWRRRFFGMFLFRAEKYHYSNVTTQASQTKIFSKEFWCNVIYLGRRWDEERWWGNFFFLDILPTMIWTFSFSYQCEKCPKDNGERKKGV